jgi:hypothetical protein
MIGSKASNQSPPSLHAFRDRHEALRVVMVDKREVVER